MDKAAESAQADEEPLLPAQIVFQTWRRRHHGTLCLYGILYVASLALTSIVTLIVSVRFGNHRPASVDTGFRTDFGPARKIIRTYEEVFAGSPLFDADGHEYFPSDSPSLQYIGSGPEVDAAWKLLSQHRYFVLTDEEAKEAWGEDYVEYWDDARGGYLAGLDVFHTLHCLDHLRMSLYPDVYHLGGLHGAEHQVHCIDHIRQILMCNADITPNPSRFYAGIGENYVISNQAHTCRDFSRIRHWATERFNGSLRVLPRHRDGSPREEFFCPKCEP